MKKTLLLFIGIVFWVGNANAAPEDIEGFPTIWSKTVYNTYFDEDDSSDWIWEMYGFMYSRFKGWTSYYSLENGSSMKADYYSVRRDSVVEEKTYSKVLFKHFSVYGANTDTLLYRQEGDKIYYRSSEGEEQTIVDYSLSVGDVFTDATGERFTVTEAGFFEEYKDQVERYTSNQPKMLRLVSENGGQEDVWIEGIGSVNWGIVPLFIAKDLKPFPARPVDSKVIYARDLLIECMPYTNEEVYKVRYTPLEERVAEETVIPWTFAFHDDTLYVSGKSYVSCGMTKKWIECSILDGNIDVDLGDYQPMYELASCGEYWKVEAKIPGFKAGTYQVGLAGGEHQTLVCNPTNGIALTPALSQGEGGIYDLSGRKISDNSNSKIISHSVNGSFDKSQNSKLKKGIYIKGRKKVMVK